MDRSKVLELAREAMVSIRGHYDETGATPQELERFAALIERGVRGGAEPVAWMYEWDGKKHLTFTDQRPIEQSHPHFNKSAPLYTHPAPAVVRQLVEALETLVGWEEAEAEHFDAEAPDDWIMDKARRALAAAKEAGL